MSPIRLRHRVHLVDPKAHLIEVETTVVPAAGHETLPPTLTLFMAVWTPGSYLVREYSRHVEGLEADGGSSCTKIRKNAWLVRPRDPQSAVVRYRVYANDLTVRTNHVDETHLYLNGACTFLAVEGAEDAAAEITFVVPDTYRAATSLPPVPGRPLTFVAKDFDTLVDCPIELGEFRETSFVTQAGVAHRFAVWPPDAITE